MNNNDREARERIIKVVIDMLDEVENIDRITVRQVAERANVGTGLINYHFRSKDNLLSIAIGEVMTKMASGFTESGGYTGMEPTAKLKAMLKELYGFAAQYEKLIRFSVTHSIMNGDMQAPLSLIPVLKEIFGDRKNEIELRIIALQILLPIQVTSISAASFRFYSGVDLYNEAQRNSYIDTLVDNLVK